MQSFEKHVLLSFSYKKKAHGKVAYLPNWNYNNRFLPKKVHILPTNTFPVLTLYNKIDCIFILLRHCVSA